MDIDGWMRQLIDGLTAAFGGRLLFVGLQGSRARGEASPGSDIDAVVVLDNLGPDDLDAYRAVLDAMPERDKTCGFFGGREELAAWPRQEMFQFVRDTIPYHGDLAGLIPPVDEADARAGARAGAAAIYHMVCHARLHADAAGLRDTLRAAGKCAFFVLQALHYLRSGRYIGTRAGLVRELPASEAELLTYAVPDRTAPADADGDAEYSWRLLRWAGEVLTSL